MVSLTKLYNRYFRQSRTKKTSGDRSTHNKNVYDISLTCLFVGQCNTGKSNLASVLDYACNKDKKKKQKQYKQQQQYTIGAELHVYHIQHQINSQSQSCNQDENHEWILDLSQSKGQDLTVKLCCWDLPGQTMFKTIVHSYFHSANVIFLFCDTNYPQITIEWLHDCSTHQHLNSKQHQIFLVCGNSNNNVNNIQETETAIKQLQADITNTFPHLIINGSFIFDINDEHSCTNLLHQINFTETNNLITCYHHD